MAWVKFVILIILVISFKLCKGNFINTPSVLVFNNLDLANCNIDKLFKAIKNKYIPTAIILVNGKKYIAVLRQWQDNIK